jgi:hypothetical protein
MIHTTVVFVPATGPRCAGAGRLWHVAIMGVVRMVVRVGYVAVPMLVRVVVMLLAVRVQAPLGQPEASQANQTDAQPEPHVTHLGRCSPWADQARSLAQIR